VDRLLESFIGHVTVLDAFLADNVNTTLGSLLMFSEFHDELSRVQSGDYSRRIWRSPKTATVAEFGDCCRQCGQGFSQPRKTCVAGVLFLSGS